MSGISQVARVALTLAATAVVTAGTVGFGTAVAPEPPLPPATRSERPSGDDGPKQTTSIPKTTASSPTTIAEEEVEKGGWVSGKDCFYRLADVGIRGSLVMDKINGSPNAGVGRNKWEMDVDVDYGTLEGPPDAVRECRGVKLDDLRLALPDRPELAGGKRLSIRTRNEVQSGSNVYGYSLVVDGQTELDILGSDVELFDPSGDGERGDGDDRDERQESAGEAE
ncbi:MAG: hypothetical protein R2754_17755 [Microthrixaceae bacterium]